MALATESRLSSGSRAAATGPVGADSETRRKCAHRLADASKPHGRSERIPLAAKRKQHLFSQPVAQARNWGDRTCCNGPECSRDCSRSPGGTGCASNVRLCSPADTSTRTKKVLNSEEGTNLAEKEMLFQALTLAMKQKKADSDPSETASPEPTSATTEPPSSASVRANRAASPVSNKPDTGSKASLPNPVKVTVRYTGGEDDSAKSVAPNRLRFARFAGGTGMTDARRRTTASSQRVLPASLDAAAGSRPFGGRAPLPRIGSRC